jgi:hypothetical protein
MAQTYEPIATTTLGTATSTISFTSIAASWTDLRIIYSGSGSNTTLTVNFNNDTANNYAYTQIRGDGTSVTGARLTTQSPMGLASLDSAIPNVVIIDVFSYTGSKRKISLISDGENRGGGSGFTRCSAYLWNSASAITSINLVGGSGFNLSAGATATLYGIKAA